ncbi:MAG: hypothetical protein HY260_02950 [Chloroflexi bacterium]|nr:hypothetical protein [Chloroflexota bacterium]
MDEHTYENGDTPQRKGFGEALSTLRRVAWVMMEDYKMKRGMIFGGILVAALVAFEMFNFSTTDFALKNILGDERFLGVPWATILAVAFCGIDFAGLARLFTPEQGKGEPVEVWYLIGAWFLGATLNAMATWWAVTLALLGRNVGNEVLSRAEMLTFVPVFVAALVWLTRILIIGTFSVAGERLFSQAEEMVRVETARRAVSKAASHRPAAPVRIIGDSESVPRAPAQPSPLRGLGDMRPAAAGVSMKPAAPFTRPAPKPSERQVTGDEWREGRAAPPGTRHTSPGARSGNGATGAKGIE